MKHNGHLVVVEMMISNSVYIQESLPTCRVSYLQRLDTRRAERLRTLTSSPAVHYSRCIVPFTRSRTDSKQQGT